MQTAKMSHSDGFVGSKEQLSWDHGLYMKKNYMTAPQMWSQNVLIAPCWLAAV